MKKILLFFIFTQTVLSQSIAINTTTYTVPQLVTSVLFGAGTTGNVCSGTISNITWDTGTNYSSTNGIGYFTNSNPTFPLQSGVILSSGNVTVAPGPNSSTQSNGSFSWPGDNQLFTYIDNLGIDAGLSSYNNATKLEFDFVPLTNQMSFDFLFASEEYGTFQCSYSDAFAFFLTNVTAGTAPVNLALIPNTTIPISVTTIRDTQYNTSCGSANVAYFGSYTDSSTPSAATAPTNFNGLTKKMTAASAVIPNNTYHIKLVVADRNDSAMDSAVFLGGGSFNIGTSAITGAGNYDGVTAFTVANGQAICNGGTRIIKAGSTQIAGTTYSWSLNGTPILGANGYTYTVTQAGTYTGTITYSTGCTQTNSIIVEYLPAIPAGTPSDLYQPLTNPIFNLTNNSTATLNGLNSSDYDINYHLTLAGAENIDGSIPNPNAFVGTDGQTIYVSINDFTNGCIATRSFVLHLTSTPIIPGTPPSLTLCDDASNDGLATFDFTNQTSFALGANNPANFTVSYHLTSADATAGTAAINPITSFNGTNGQMIYVRVQENANPTVNFATTSFQLFVNPTPPASTIAITQPICTVPTGTITVNSPLSGSPLPNELFISEVTDEDVGSLTYIEIYNGTGSSKNLSNYKIKVYNNGSSSASCDLPLSGTLANNSTFVLAVGSATNVGSVTPNQVNASCGGINDNDNIRLTTNSNVEIDLWGRTDGATFTPNNQPGYTYRRLATSNPPSTTWNPANWLAFDYQTYSNVGSYSTSNFQYSLDGGSYQASTTFSGVPTGTHTVTVKDMITGCISNGTNAVINAVPPFITPSFVAAPAVCSGSNLSAYLATSSTNGITGTWFPLPNNTSTTNYTFTPNPGQCANNAAMTITITPPPTATISGTTSVCVNDAAPTVTFTGAGATAPYTFTYTTDGVTNQTVTSDATGVATITVPTATAGTVNVNLVRVEESSSTTCGQLQTGTATITINPLPTATVTGTIGVCLNDPDPTVTFTGSGATAPYTFTYNIDGGTNQTLVSDAAGIATITVAATTIGVYHINLVSIQDSSATACTKLVNGTAIVTVNEIPSVTVANVTICLGTNATVTAVPATAGNYSYVWTYPSGATDPGNTAVFTTAVPGPYDVVITNTATGCVSPSATGTVSTIAAPTVATPIADLHFCDPDNDGIGTFNLAALQTALLAQYPTYTFTFHETPTDAATGASPIALSYNNINNWLQVIYIRVLSSGLPCYTAIPLNLIVDPTPEATTPLPYHVCDDDYDGIGTFNLNTLNAQILGTINPTLNSVTYYYSLTDAQTNATPIAGVTAFNNTILNTQTIYAMVTTIATGCSDIVPVVLVVDPLPFATQPGYTPVSLCETTAYGVGFEEFNLQAQVGNILLGQTGMDVTFYPSLTDAQNNTNPITAPTYVNTIAIVQTLGIRVTNPVTGCFVTSTMDIRVEPLPLITPLTPLHFCDADNDGVGTFDLATLQTTLIGQYPGYSNFSFYETQTDAEQQHNPIALSYNNIDLWTQTVYIRVETALGCFDVFPLNLIVDPTPLAVTPNPYHVCDDNTDGIAVFNLPSLDTQILGTMNPTLNTVSYYLSLTDEAANNPIAGATAFTNTTATHQVIYADVITTATGCRKTVTVDLFVDPLPLATQPGYAPYSLCETPAYGIGHEAFDLQSQIPSILLGQTGMNVTFYPSLTDAQNNTAVITSPSAYVNATAIVQTLGIRVTDAITGCYVTSTIDVRVQPLPLISPVTPLHFCDADNDGIGTFNLAALQTSLIAQYPAYTNFSFYETATNAQTLSNPLPLSYNNIYLWNQTIYVRVETIGLTCFEVFPVNLIVDPTPTATAPQDYHVCDDDTDGISVFNLTTLDTQILGAMNPALNTVSYYPTLADAQAGTNAIGGTNAFSNGTPNHQTIYAAVITTATGCRTTAVVELYVDPIPTATQPGYPAYSICETPANGIGYEAFDLTTQIPAIVGTQTGVNVTFYPSLLDAQNNTGAITNPAAYVNTSATVQTLGIRVSSITSTGCYVTSTIDIRVQPLPALAPIPALHFCDADNDGVGTFNLAALQTSLIAQYPAYTNFSFYETPTDAQTQHNPLSLSYNNINPWNQTIYIHVDTIGLPCFEVFSVNLVVDPTPIATAPQDYHVCDDNTDGISVFNLTTLDTQILGTMNPATNTVSYYPTLADAQAGTNAIGGINTFSNSTPFHQTIYAAVITTATGCRNTAVVELYVDPIPTATQPGYPAYSVCETPAHGNGFEAFDLTTQIPAIIGTQTGVNVTFYPSLLDAQNNTNAITTANAAAYVNTIATVQTLGIRVSSSTATGCFAISTIDIRVQPLPLITPITPLHFCDADNDGIGTFNLAALQASLIAQYPAYTNFSFYETATNAQTLSNPLPLSYNNINLWNQTIYVLVDTIGLPCFDVFPVTLVVDPTPVATAPQDYHVCDDNTDGISVFNLTTLDTQILGTMNPATNTVSYYPTLADAQAGTNAIGGTNTFSNSTPFHQTIYAAVITTATGCRNTTVVELYVDPIPTATQPGYPAYSVCETPAHGNGFEAFDLTTQIAAIIGTQTGVSVTFYPSLLDAQNNTGAITAAAAAAYVNTVPNVQTLGIRVSSTTATGCFAISTIDIRVEPLPVLAPIPALHFCDANNDGVGSFDLATLLTSLVAQYPGYSGFSIHETQTDAENNVNALGSPYSNIDLWNQTVYIHVNSNTVNCSNVFTLNLIVDPTPVATTPQDYHVCDDNTDGISVFNLTTLDAQVLGTLNPALYTVSYYLTLADAQAGTAAIGSATTFNNTVANHQTIYAAVITTATGCRNTAVVELYVDPIPTATQPAYAPYSVCETPAYGIGFEAFNLTSQIPTIIGTQTGVSVTFYPSLLDAQNNTAAITNPAAYVNTPAFVQTLGIRVSATTSTGCFAISTMDIRVEPLPVLAPLTALHYCDPNNDGVGVFDLATLQATLAAQYPTYSGFTIHETPTDAITGANPLVSPYNNIDLWNQTVYVHVNAATAACNAYFPLNLVVDPTPVASIPQPYHVCDNDADGISVFNLTTLDAQVLGTLNPALYTVSYYLTLADAQAGTAAIGSASTFSNTVINHQTIYAAVITNATGCRNTAVVELYVDPLPLATQPAYAPFSICETPAYGIGFEAFNLQSHAQALLLGQTGVGVTFYPSLLDAQNNTNAIATPAAYVNTNPFVQTLGVRLTSTSATACYVISTMDIRVQPLPVLIPPTGPFVACDTNQDGITQFDLCTTITPVVDPNLSYIITYYETLTDAQTGLVVNQLPCLYTNINSSFVQFIYVRAQDPITGCFTVMQVELNVDPSPVMPTLPTMAMCDYDNNNQNGCFTFDLTTQSAAILAAQAPGSYTVSYYLTQADASHSPMGTFPIVNASSYYTCTGQIIWVRVENNTTHCFAVGSFALTVNAPIVLVTPAPLKVCDNDTAPNDLHTTFDLTLQNDSITGVVGSTGFTVNYYNHFVLPMPVNGVVLPPATLITNPATYVNFQNSVETLLVEVINNATGCKGYTTLTIRVLPVPTPNTNPTTLPAECETTTGSGVAVFDLTTNANYIMNNDPNVVLHYYPTHADMVAHTNEIMTPATATVGDPTIAGTTINQVQYVYIAVTSNIFIDSNGYNCYVEVKQGFIVNPLPVVASIPNYQICQDLATNNGIATFDLTSQITALLVGNSTTPVSTYSVAFYTTNPPTAASLITNPTAYINTASPNSQTIYVVVTNDITHCTSAVGQFNIVVNPKPVLGIAMADYATCDTDGTNDGYHNYPQNPTSTLTGLAGYVNDLLGPTQQTGFTVYFYDNQADALAGTVANAITNLATYPVHSNMYWVRIENDVTHCFILDSFETIIEQLPQPKIVTSLNNNVMCVDFTNNQVVRPLTLTIVDTTAYLDYDNNPATYPTPTQITPAPTYLYQWYVDGVAITGATAATYSPPASTTGAIRNYTVVMTSTTLVPAGGCASSTCAPFPVIQSGQAVAIGNNGGYTITNAFADNQTITVTVDGWGAPDYQYSLDDGAPQVSPVFSNVTLGEHTITVWDIKGGTMSCDPLVIEHVQTIDYPHYFTPNGDGINDYWNIVGLYNQPNAKIYIFDRFGKLIKQISSQSEGWDGTFNGNTLPATDYWFTVDYSEANALKQFKAHFSLKR